MSKEEKRLSKGLFLVLEGIDGCGKSTQAKMLEDRLRSQNIPVVLTREPGGTATGESIRNLLLSPESRICNCTEILLYAAARAQLVDEIIQPALSNGETVVCDRFVWSTLAYQGAGRGEAETKIYRLNEEVTGGLTPDLTVILDLEVEEARNRLELKQSPGKKVDRLENMDLSFYQRVREKYLSFARQDPASIVVVSAEGPPAKVHRDIWSRVEALLHGV